MGPVAEDVDVGREVREVREAVLQFKAGISGI
jgi:hypothetical protein